MLILPDSSVLIPYLVRHAYVVRVERAMRRNQLVLCSVVAEEILAGARDTHERRGYDAFFAAFRRLGLTATPDDEAWHTCGRVLSRYQERYGAIEPRDHQNDVLIVLSALRLAREQETMLITENDTDLTTWLSLLRPRSGLRIVPVRCA